MNAVGTTTRGCEVDRLVAGNLNSNRIADRRAHIGRPIPVRTNGCMTLGGGHQVLAAGYGDLKAQGHESFTSNDLKSKGVSDFEGDQLEASGHRSASVLRVYDVLPSKPNASP